METIASFALEYKHRDESAKYWSTAYTIDSQEVAIALCKEYNVKQRNGFIWRVVKVEKTVVGE